LHGNHGKVSNRAIELTVKEQILSTYKKCYPDFGPTFAAEKLEEVEGLKVSGETLRQWLVKEGLWQRKRKRSEHRSRRDRRPCFGDCATVVAVQFDGSPTPLARHHDWFEGRRMSGIATQWRILPMLPNKHGLATPLPPMPQARLCPCSLNRRPRRAL
jgi:hypothetical protein